MLIASELIANDRAPFFFIEARLIKARLIILRPFKSLSSGNPVNHAELEINLSIKNRSTVD